MSYSGGGGAGVGGETRFSGLMWWVRRERVGE